MALIARTKRKRVRAAAHRRPRSSTATIAGERYTSARKAEFLLNNATTREEYRVARREVEALGLNPDSIPHSPPRSR
jgi:hypothetical protein